MRSWAMTRDSKNNIRGLRKGVANSVKNSWIWKVSNKGNALCLLRAFHAERKVSAKAWTFEAVLWKQEKWEFTMSLESMIAEARIMKSFATILRFLSFLLKKWEHLLNFKYGHNHI